MEEIQGDGLMKARLPRRTGRVGWDRWCNAFHIEVDRLRCSDSAISLRRLSTSVGDSNSPNVPSENGLFSCMRAYAPDRQERSFSDTEFDSLDPVTHRYVDAAAAQPSQCPVNMGSNACPAAALSNSGLMSVRLGAEVKGKAARQVKLQGLVAKKSGLCASRRPGSEIRFRMQLPVSRPMSAPHASRKEPPSGQEFLGTNSYSPLLKRKMEFRSHREHAATKIQSRFRGMLAREAVGAFRRAETALHKYGLRAASISCGGCPFNHATGHTAAVTKSGKLFSWGSAGCGQLGIRSTQDSLVPMQVGHCRHCNPEASCTEGGLLSHLVVRAVALGGSHGACLTNDGQVFTWGSAGHGQLGHKQDYTSGCATDQLGQRTCSTTFDGHCTSLRKLVPVPVGGLPKVTVIACGRYHTLALSIDGSVFSWGSGHSGQLGHGTNRSNTVPKLISHLKLVMSIAAGVLHSGAVTVQGELFTWGNGGCGRLGHGNLQHKLVPTQVLEVPSIRLVHCGAAHTLALSTPDGKVFAFGAGSEGQLGSGGTHCLLSPTRVRAGLDSIPVKAISAGSYHSAAVSNVGGRLFLWGRADCGQLGTGSNNYQLEPIEIPLNYSPPGQNAVESVSCGPYQTGVVLADGTTLMCGHGASGQLGNDSTEDRFRFSVVHPPGEHRLVKQIRHKKHVKHEKVKKWANGTLWLWSNSKEFWQECSACALYKRHACFCKVKCPAKKHVV